MPKSSAKMNEDLQKWLNEKQKELKQEEPKEKNKIKPKGMCQVCGEKNATIVCIKCGKNVCKSCHFKLIGICKKCVAKGISGKWDGSNPDWEKKLGVEWVD